MIEDKITRGFRWHATRWFAAYAIGFCVFLVAFLVGLVVAGPEFTEVWFGWVGGVVLWASAFASLPLVYRRLKP